MRPAIRIVTDEAEAALAVLGERQETGSVKPESWERLWKSEGFVRLKKREESFGAKEVEESFRKSRSTRILRCHSYLKATGG